MELTNGKIDRRKYIRLTKSIPLMIKIEGMPDFQDAYSKNISEGGIFLEWPFKDEQTFSNISRFNSSLMGKKVSISISISDKNELRTAGEITWIKRQELPFEKKLEAGVRFVGLGEIDRTKLSTYIFDILKMQQKSFIFDKIVYLSDTNAEGNVYFTRYFDWQGQAREEFYRQHFPLSIWQKGIKLITVNASTDYKHECFLFDAVAIEIKIANLKKMSLELIFIYRNKRTNQSVAIGKEKIAFADPNGKLIPIPEEIKKITRYFLTDEDIEAGLH